MKIALTDGDQRQFSFTWSLGLFTTGSLDRLTAWPIDHCRSCRRLRSFDLQKSKDRSLRQLLHLHRV